MVPSSTVHPPLVATGMRLPCPSTHSDAMMPLQEYEHNTITKIPRFSATCVHYTPVMDLRKNP